MTKLQWTTVQKKVSDLVPHSKNPRTISQKQINDLKRSLKKFNLVEIPVINTDNTVLAGHQRLKVLQLIGRGDEMIDVRVPNRKLTKDEAERYLVGSNALGGNWDIDLLKEFDINLLSDVGFDMNELSDMWSEVLKINDEDFDAEKEVQKIKKPKTKVGDLIQLGNSRLICGDSRNPEVLKKLCGDEKVSMIFSDMPYNLGVDYDKGIGGKQHYGGDVDDSKSDEEYMEFVRKSMEAALSVSHDDLHIFYWSAQKYIWLVQTLYRELGIENRRVCLWVKNGHNPTPSVAFNSSYEPCTYGTQGNPYLSKRKDLTEILNADVRNGNDLLDDIWTVKRLAANKYSHPTMKPSSLCEKPIARCTKVNDIVLDSFAGSGSTLIAAHKLKRRAYCVELSPVFCDLIIRRFESLTGITAKVIKAYDTAPKETAIA